MDGKKRAAHFVIGLLLAYGIMLLLPGCAFLGSSSATGLAAPGPDQPIPPETVQPGGEVQLHRALSWVPAAGTRKVRFTSWTKLKAHFQIGAISSAATPKDARVSFMARVTNQGLAPAMFDGVFFPFMAENWGLDSSDLLWEAVAENDNLVESIHILRLQDGFDDGTLRQHLANRSFEQTTDQGISVYHAPLETEAEWHFASPLAMHTVAFHTEENLLLLSPSRERIHEAIAVGSGSAASMLQLPGVAGIAADLEDTAGSVIYLGEEACEVFSPASMAGQQALNAQAELEARPVSPYSAMAAGHILVAGEQQELLLFHYEDMDTATADFEARQGILNKGLSPNGIAYGAQFYLDFAERDGADMNFVLTATPGLRARYGWPQNLAGWLEDGDALFAACNTGELTVVDGLQ